MNTQIIKLKNIILNEQINIFELFEYIGSYSNVLIIIYIMYSILYKNYNIYNNYHKSVTKNNSINQIIYFIWVLALNIIINILLKNIIKSPRPIDKSKYGIGYEYGMPSGHAQLVTFLLLFILNIDTSVYIKIIALLLTILTYVHRYVFNYHTINQIIGGIIMGWFLWIILL